MNARTTRRLGTAGAAMSLALAACHGGDSAATAAAKPPLRHGKLQGKLTVDAIERSYLVHVPDAIDGSKRVPVVVMIHGTSGTGERFYNISGWVEKANAEGFIAVFPTALVYCLGKDDDFDAVIEPQEYSITTKWAAGALGTAAMPLCTDAEVARFPPARQAEIQSRSVRDDVAFFRAIVAAIEAELPVDPKRMYVTGFSNGGQMSARLMIEMSDTFAAFAMAAGGPAVPGPALRPVPAVFSVGSLDDGFVTSAGVAELPLDESIVDLPSFQALIGRLGGALGLDTSRNSYAARQVGGKTIGQTTYDHSLVGASNQLVLAVIEDATHQYPNGTNHPVVMADQLWPFFRQYALP